MKRYINVLTKGYIPDNTKKNTAWSLKVFNEWRCSREGNCPAELLTSGKFDDLNYWIPRFVNKARRADGCAYPPRTINQLLAALQRYMLGENHLLPKFMDCHNALRSYERISVSRSQQNFNDQKCKVKV